MKHLLPILTLALLGVASTASAEFYYDYYQNPGQTTGPTEIWKVDDWNTYAAKTDTFSYNDFEVTRYSLWTRTNLEANIGQSNFYRIRVLGDEGAKVNLYLTDFVDNAGSATNDSALYKNIEAYGYRKLNSVEINGETQYVANGEAKKFFLTGDDAVTPTVKDSVYVEKKQYDETGTTIVKDESYTVKRFQYSLGEFTSGEVIELYMQDSVNPDGVYSYSNFNGMFLNNDVLAADGGFGDGGYVVNEQTDELMHDYYYQDKQMLAAKLTPFTNEDARVDAANKSMPLSTLTPSATTGGLYFGIFASAVTLIDDNQGGSGTGGGSGAVGNPLPGGLQLALIAGLFGLGFWYIRRRKATVA